MNLQAYLELNDETKAAFAARLGVNPATVTRLVNGDRVPSGKLLSEIQRITYGAVGVGDFQWNQPRKETAA